MSVKKYKGVRWRDGLREKKKKKHSCEPPSAHFPTFSRKRSNNNKALKTLFSISIIIPIPSSFFPGIN